MNNNPYLQIPDGGRRQVQPGGGEQERAGCCGPRPDRGGRGAGGGLRHVPARHAGVPLPPQVVLLIAVECAIIMTYYEGTAPRPRRWRWRG